MDLRKDIFKICIFQSVLVDAKIEHLQSCSLVLLFQFRPFSMKLWNRKKFFSLHLITQLSPVCLVCVFLSLRQFEFFIPFLPGAVIVFTVHLFWNFNSFLLFNYFLFLSALPHALLFCSCYSFFWHVWFIMHSSANVISTSIHLQINSHICKAHSVNPHTAGLCSSSSVYSAFFSNELWTEHYGNQFVANQCNVFQHQMMCFSVRQSEEDKWQCKLEK